MIAYSQNQIQKEKFKNSFWKWRNHQFLLSKHEVGMRLTSVHVAVEKWLFQTKMSEFT